MIEWIMRWTKPSRGRARRDEDEKLEKTDGLEERPVVERPRLKMEGAECRAWWVEKPLWLEEEEWPLWLRVGEPRRRT